MKLHTLPIQYLHIIYWKTTEFCTCSLGWISFIYVIIFLLLQMTNTYLENIYVRTILSTYDLPRCITALNILKLMSYLKRIGSRLTLYNNYIICSLPKTRYVIIQLWNTLPYNIYFNYKLLRYSISYNYILKLFVWCYLLNKQRLWFYARKYKYLKISFVYIVLYGAHIYLVPINYIPTNSINIIRTIGKLYFLFPTIKKFFILVIKISSK